MRSDSGSATIPTVRLQFPPCVPFVAFPEIQGNGFKTLKENQKVEFEMKDGPKGKQAAQIKPIA